MYYKQVNSSHYNFSKYMSQQRWASVWHQANEIISFRPKRVLEVGPGAGALKAVIQAYGFNLETMDLDPDLNPDHIGSAEKIPFPDGEYDAVCAFQMLEHLPYEVSLKAFQEMCRVALNRVIISLPDAYTAWPASFYVPKYGHVRFFIPKVGSKNRIHEFDGQHFWEINKKGYLLKNIICDFEKYGGVKLYNTYRVHENPYHRFLVFLK